MSGRYGYQDDLARVAEQPEIGLELEGGHREGGADGQKAGVPWGDAGTLRSLENRVVQLLSRRDDLVLHLQQALDHQLRVVARADHAHEDCLRSNDRTLDGQGIQLGYASATRCTETNRLGAAFPRLASREFVVQQGHLRRELSLVSVAAWQLHSEQLLLNAAHNGALLLLLPSRIRVETLAELEMKCMNRAEPDLRTSSQCTPILHPHCDSY